jgi:SAM-dependent methyltransferase
MDSLATRALNSIQADGWRRTTFKVYRRVYMRLFGSALSRWIRDRSIRRLTSGAAGNAYRRDETYRTYLHDQIRKSFTLTRWYCGEPPLNARTVSLVGKLTPFLTGANARTVLCVGCRNGRELDHIEEKCGVTAVGLDLFSEDPRIRTGDMHKMPFRDNEFDALYSCHSLEHSFDVKQAASEFLRVTKPGGHIAIEVPVNFQPTSADRWDATSSQRLVDLFGPPVGVVLFEDNTPREARVIVKVTKQQ